MDEKISANKKISANLKRTIFWISMAVLLLLDAVLLMYVLKGGPKGLDSSPIGTTVVSLEF